jgi:hypothetical protein
MARSVAFKCTFNDGGSGEFVGLHGTCSRDLMVLNVNTHVWCSQSQNRCRQFYESGMKGPKPEFPCMESELFELWRFNGGTWHNGPRQGQQIPVTDAAIGKVVVLTTRRPSSEERDRKIIGLYEIAEIDAESNLIAHPQYRIRLLAKDAERLDFWRYYRNSNDPKPVWGTMLFRYLEDSSVHRILADMADVVGGKTRETVDLLIERHFGGAVAPPAVGALATAASIRRAVAIGNKYPGGEGPHHKALKEWIAKHPEAIGLPQGAKADVEHVFVSGDCVDIAFTLPDASKVVVEIETTHPFPGAHQVIKYRALMHAEMGWPLDSNRVRGVLVAWDYGCMDLAFCGDYEVVPWKCRTGCKGTLAKM